MQYFDYVMLSIGILNLISIYLVKRESIVKMLLFLHPFLLSIIILKKVGSIGYLAFFSFQILTFISIHSNEYSRSEIFNKMDGRIEAAYKSIIALMMAGIIYFFIGILNSSKLHNLNILNFKISEYLFLFLVLGVAQLLLKIGKGRNV